MWKYHKSDTFIFLFQQWMLTNSGFILQLSFHHWPSLFPFLFWNFEYVNRLERYCYPAVDKNRLCQYIVWYRLYLLTVLRSFTGTSRHCLTNFSSKTLRTPGASFTQRVILFITTISVSNFIASSPIVLFIVTRHERCLTFVGKYKAIQIN